MEEIQQEEKKHNGNDIFHIKEKIYEMILYGNPQLKDFPKTERYVLAGDIRKTMYTMLEMAVRLEKKYHKKTTLQDLDIEVDVLRKPYGYDRKDSTNRVKGVIFRSCRQGKD